MEDNVNMSVMGRGLPNLRLLPWTRLWNSVSIKLGICWLHSSFTQTVKKSLLL